jgi:hypothetical protein
MTFSIRRLGCIAAAAVATLSGCAIEPVPVDGVVIKKVYAPLCTTDAIMGTASGALAYEEDHTEEWFVVVKEADGHRARVLLSEDDWTATDVGDTYKAADTVWPYQPGKCRRHWRVEQ